MRPYAKVNICVLFDNKYERERETEREKREKEDKEIEKRIEDSQLL